MRHEPSSLTLEKEVGKELSPRVKELRDKWTAVQDQFIGLARMKDKEKVAEKEHVLEKKSVVLMEEIARAQLVNDTSDEYREQRADRIALNIYMREIFQTTPMRAITTYVNEVYKTCTEKFGNRDEKTFQAIRLRHFIQNGILVYLPVKGLEEPRQRELHGRLSVMADKLYEKFPPEKELKV
ncbi:MAG: hypothetical protein Q7R79_05445 [bacterium]|nr:hypothetical protein [bacterium]